MSLFSNTATSPTPHLILLNGPPSSGKDAAAEYLARQVHIYAPSHQYPVRLRRMSHPIKQAFAGLMSADISPDGHVDGWEKIKDIPTLLLNGRSYRRWQIDFSEVLMKPLYGHDIFARLFHKWTKENPASVLLVPDCGFTVELNYLALAFGAARIMLLRIHRPGRDFSSDSRSYLTHPTIHSIDIHNDGTLADYHAQLDRVVLPIILDKLR